jgi:hypothetical protein
VYFDPALNQWIVVQAHTVVDASQSRIEVELDNQSVPLLTSLRGTFFAVRKASADAGAEASPDATATTDATSPDATSPADATATTDATSPTDTTPPTPDASAGAEQDAGETDAQPDHAVDASLSSDATVADAPNERSHDAASGTTRDAAQDGSSPLVDANGAPPQGPAADSEGCGCRIAAGSRGPAPYVGVLIALAMLSRRTRRRQR